MLGPVSRTRSGWSIPALVLYTFAVSNCGGDSTGPLDIDAILITPEALVLDIAETRQAVARLTTAGGNVYHRRVSWTSSDDRVASVNQNGRITGVSQGWATVSATFGGVVGEATVRVIEPGAYDCSAQSAIAEVECVALEALYDATNEPGWKDPAGWLTDPDPCTWKGVVCDGGSVWKLRLGFNDLAGPLPSELKYLSSLEQLELGSNDLTGPIPTELADLSALRFLNLHSNHLTGPIPPELGTLTALTHLIMGINQLTGSIPPELGNLATLEQLTLFSNQLTGAIPPELGNLPNLAYLQLNRNQLTGSIPSELADLPRLERLELNENQLTGTIPPGLGTLLSLERLYLDSNQLSGSLPPELGNLPSLEWLRLQDNQLTGVVPIEVAQMGGLLQATLGAIHCVFAPPGNDGLQLSGAQDYHDADLDGDGFICGMGFPP